MPRQRALRLLGGALVSVAVPGFVTRKALAGSATCGAGEIVCKCSCKGDKCTDCTGAICLVNCCRSSLGEYCDCAGHAGCWVKPCRAPCPSGFKCCEDDEFCANSQQHLCCKRGQRGCGLECCAPNEECKKIRVGTASKDICTKRCPPNRAWCGRDNCCPPKWKCINERTGLCKRCWPEEEECGKKCCDKKTSRCCGKAGCCPKNRACCNIGKEQKCCPAGQKCAIPILGGDIGIKPGTKVVCCPTARFSENPKLCCPPGQVALNTPGFRTPPPGISPFCCPPSLICGSGTSKICANLQGDSQNCGGCGNVCESGICNGGICALP